MEELDATETTLVESQNSKKQAMYIHQSRRATKANSKTVQYNGQPGSREIYAHITILAC